ncbi:hypothetical protein GCM10010331_29360 [Streptomyces xanthochromogenes]|nr:hypothetical protein GCM10010331_29360 [Streptomyces xanthochromogenes]
MRGRALVQGHQLVRLGARETAASVQEVFEAVPLRTVGGHEDVEVHVLLLLQALGTYGLYYCGALRVSLADCEVQGVWKTVVCEGWGIG